MRINNLNIDHIIIRTCVQICYKALVQFMVKHQAILEVRPCNGSLTGNIRIYLIIPIIRICQSRILFMGLSLIDQPQDIPIRDICAAYTVTAGMIIWISSCIIFGFIFYCQWKWINIPISIIHGNHIVNIFQKIHTQSSITISAFCSHGLNITGKNNIDIGKSSAAALHLCRQIHSYSPVFFRSFVGFVSLLHGKTGYFSVRITWRSLVNNIFDVLYLSIIHPDIHIIIQIIFFVLIVPGKDIIFILGINRIIVIIDQLQSRKYSILRVHFLLNLLFCTVEDHKMNRICNFVPLLINYGNPLDLRSLGLIHIFLLVSWNVVISHPGLIRSLGSSRRQD